MTRRTLCAGLCAQLLLAWSASHESPAQTKPSVSTDASSTPSTYYVSPKGNDAGMGTDPEHPLRTVQAGVDRLRPGDTLLLRAGTYREKVRITRGGSDEQRRITIRSYAGESAVLDGTGVPVAKWAALMTLEGCSFVTVSNLDIRNSAQDGVQVLKDATHVRLEKLKVHDCGNSGLSMWKLGRPAYVYVCDGEYYANYRAGIHLASVLGGYAVVEGNQVHDNKCADNYDAIQAGIGDPGTGIHHVAVRRNQVYQNRPRNEGGGDAIDMGGLNSNVSHLLIDGNRLWGKNGLVKFSRTVKYAIMRRNVSSGGAFIDLYGPPYPGCSIYHNTLSRTRHCVQFGVGNLSGGATKPARDVSWGGLQIRNNLFFGGDSYILNIWTPKLNRGPESIRLDGNLYRVGNGQAGMYELEEWWTASPDAHRVVTELPAEKLFTDPGKNDLSLCEGSPAVDAAPPLTHARAAGSGTELPVRDARYFVDGWDSLFEADALQVGQNAAVPIRKVDYERNIITLATAITWQAGDAVSLPWSGKAPDVGALERAGK